MKVYDKKKLKKMINRLFIIDVPLIIISYSISLIYTSKFIIDNYLYFIHIVTIIVILITIYFKDIYFDLMVVTE